MQILLESQATQEADGVPKDRWIVDVTPERAPSLWDQHRGDLGDFIHEFRDAHERTGIPAREWSRHYESEEVGAELRDGAWVGWTYWSGGGKHGEPEAIPWIENAYYLDVTEALRPVRIFKIRGAEVED